MLFLSVGSNYTLRQTWRHLLTVGKPKHSELLASALLRLYDGEKVLLFSKGRAALSEAVRLSTGGKGKVAVTSLTCYVVIEAIKTAGCQPIFIDIDKTSLQFSPVTLKDAFTKHPDIKAVIVQNTLGIPADIDEIIKVARNNNAEIIEDLAHAVGAKYADGRKIGSVGDYAMLSFGRDKMIDTINGGALIVRTKKVNDVLRPPQDKVMLAQQLRDRFYPIFGHAVRILFNVGLGKYLLAALYKLRLAVRSADGGTEPSLKLPHWQAKLALDQINNLDKKVKKRLANQDKYTTAMSNLTLANSSNAVRLPLLVNNRETVLNSLRQNGYFFEDVWYEVPVSPARLYSSVNFPEADNPVALSISEKILNLPTHQLVKDEDIARISKIIVNEAKQ